MKRKSKPAQTVTAAEVIELSEFGDIFAYVVADSIYKESRDHYLKHGHGQYEYDWAIFRAIGNVWEAGRIQGIRDERKRRSNRGDDMAQANFDYDIVERIAVLSQKGSITKELSKVSYNGADPKYDIRAWKHTDGEDKPFPYKGVTLTEKEMEALKRAVTEL